MNKRVSSRGIIIENDYVYLMFRRRIKIEDLDKIDVMGKDMIIKAFNNIYATY